ncbi:FRAT-87 protein [uncultured Dubosiella sp.]|uniref:FRAT-87 protein n=1 Tax=uncultured Dubosiella sp. TaxID=1937011 RepID=UPI00207DE9E9|nr:FRAT-87 protein [uncultured Dubosiella sp.]GJM56879.1 hypothetical protein EROP_05720 [Erysipelotrichaceae bacterium OPF54]
MTKEQFKEMLTEKIGGTPFAEEVIEDLTVNFDPEKYAQNAKDRLDERKGSVVGWAEKFYEKGQYAKAAEEYSKAAVIANALAAIAA